VPISPAQEQRILDGGIPDSAQRRLAELGGAGLTSSFFGAAEFAVGLADGVEPIGQVVGASSCRLGVGVVRRTAGSQGRLAPGDPTWHEYDGPVRSWTTARQRALARLLAQAQIVEADAVLGVTVHREVRSVTPRLAEFVLMGTAVRFEPRDDRAPRAPFAALTSPQEFCLLRAAGVDVIGIAGAFSSVRAVASSTTLNATRRWRSASVNQELDDLTTCVYEARRLAMQRLTADARALGARGVIGVDISDSLSRREGGAVGMTISVHALGTAVRRRAGDPSAPRAVIGLGA
jgi:uncharacterized protein YbjQ (UPF0145 family)